MASVALAYRPCSIHYSVRVLDAVQSFVYRCQGHVNRRCASWLLAGTFESLFVSVVCIVVFSLELLSTPLGMAEPDTVC